MTELTHYQDWWKFTTHNIYYFFFNKETQKGCCQRAKWKIYIYFNTGYVKETNNKNAKMSWYISYFIAWKSYYQRKISKMKNINSLYKIFEKILNKGNMYHWKTRGEFYWPFEWRIFWKAVFWSFCFSENFDWCNKQWSSTNTFLNVRGC